MEQYEVEHAPNRIAGVLGPDRVLDGFADGDAKASGRIGVFLQDVAPCPRNITRARNAVCPPRGHHHPSVGFLVVADPDHKDPALQAEHRAGHGERTSPLTGTGLRRKPLDPENLVVVGLWYGRVGLVGTGGLTLSFL